MAEIRNSQLICAIEPSLYALVVEKCREDSEAVSAYIRGLIIKDLADCGKLDKDKMVMIMTGQALKRVERFLAAPTEVASGAAS